MHVQDASKFKYTGKVNLQGGDWKSSPDPGRPVALPLRMASRLDRSSLTSCSRAARDLSNRENWSARWEALGGEAGGERSPWRCWMPIGTLPRLLVILLPDGSEGDRDHERWLAKKKDVKEGFKYHHLSGFKHTKLTSRPWFTLVLVLPPPGRSRRASRASILFGSKSRALRSSCSAFVGSFEVNLAERRK